MLIVTSYWLARYIVAEERPDLVLSLMDPGTTYSLPGLSPAARHVRVALHDIVTIQGEVGEPYVAPAPAHIEQISQAARTWSGKGTVLIHCGAGVSRSTAAALIFIAAREPQRIDHAARELRWAAPWAKPNGLMVELADEMLGLDGRLSRSVASMGEPRTRGVVFSVRLSAH